MSNTGNSARRSKVYAVLYTLVSVAAALAIAAEARQVAVDLRDGQALDWIVVGAFGLGLVLLVFSLTIWTVDVWKRPSWRRRTLVVITVAILALGLFSVPLETMDRIGNLSWATMADQLIALLSVGLWPTVTLIALVMFRSQIGTLVSRINKISGFGSEVHLAELALDTANDARIVEEDTRDAEKTKAPPKAAEPSSSENLGHEARPEEGVDLGLDVPSKATEWSSKLPSDSWHATDLDAYSDALTNHKSTSLALWGLVETWGQLEEESKHAFEVLVSLDRTHISPQDWKKYQRRNPTRRVFMELVEMGYVTPEALDVIRRTQELRNRLVHGGPADHSDPAIRGTLMSIASLRSTLSFAMEHIEKTQREDDVSVQMD